MQNRFIDKTDRKEQFQKIQDREKHIEKICERLFLTTVNFKEEEVYKQILEYVYQYERFLYSTISNYIFSRVQADTEFGIVNTNMERLYSYLNKLQKNGEVGDDEYELMNKVLIKIYDHVNLANRQFNELKETDEDSRKKFERYAAPYQEEISKKMSMQLLTMVSIFTALAFLMFGGISSLGSIFSNHELPILKVMIIGSVWGLCILNVVFVFLFCVGKMTKIGVASNIKNGEKEENDSNIIHKYIVVWWSDLIILTVLAGSIWTYYISENELDSWFATFCHNYSPITTTLGYIIILSIFVGITIFLFSQRKK